MKNIVKWLRQCFFLTINSWLNHFKWTHSTIIVPLCKKIQEGSRNDWMELVIFPVSAQQFGIKDMLEWHAGVTCWSWRQFWGEPYGRLHEWSETYFVTLIDRCSFLCVSGQRGTKAKPMHEEHLCVVALTSNGARNPVLSACLLPPWSPTALRLLPGE